MKSKTINAIKLNRSQQKAISGGAPQYWCCATCATPWGDDDAIGRTCSAVKTYCAQLGGTLSSACRCTQACLL